jgi:hypothetical protein
MRLLDSLTVRQGNEERTISLYEGDLAAIPPDERVDILVVSAFPNNHAPTSRTLIRALYENGVSVRELAEDKQADFRDFASCWLSKPVQSLTDAGFTQILCFEPAIPHRAPAVVGDIFRSLIAVTNRPMTVAMPLVSTGSMHVPFDEMFPVLLDAAVHWMALGLNVTHLKIVERHPEKAEAIRILFAALKAKYATMSLSVTVRKTAWR